jgi:two-component system, sensor histidine kinase
MEPQGHPGQAIHLPVSGGEGAERPRLLIVDDDKVLTSIISRIGGNAGFDAFVAHTMAEATTLISVSRVDCVTLDLSLSGEHNGIQFLRLMEELKCKAPVIVISGASSRQLELTSSLGRTLNVRVCEALQKPLDAAALRRALTRIKDNRHH